MDHSTFGNARLFALTHSFCFDRTQFYLAATDSRNIGVYAGISGSWNLVDLKSMASYLASQKSLSPITD